MMGLSTVMIWRSSYRSFLRTEVNGVVVELVHEKQHAGRSQLDLYGRCHVEACLS